MFGCGGEEWYSITRFDDEDNSCQCRLFMESEKFFAEDDESVKEKHKQDLINRWNTRKPMERILTRLEEKSEEHEETRRIAHGKGLYNVEERQESKASCFMEAIEICKEEGGIE